MLFFFLFPQLSIGLHIVGDLIGHLLNGWMSNKHKRKEGRAKHWEHVMLPKQKNGEWPGVLWENYFCYYLDKVLNAPSYQLDNGIRTPNHKHSHAMLSSPLNTAHTMIPLVPDPVPSLIQCQYHLLSEALSWQLRPGWTIIFPASVEPQTVSGTGSRTL